MIKSNEILVKIATNIRELREYLGNGNIHSTARKGKYKPSRLAANSIGLWGKSLKETSCDI